MVDGDVATVGITDHAQQQLGDIVFVDLPKVGGQVEAGKSIGTVESVKAVSDLYAPVSGEVVEANEALVEHPEEINSSPYERGWMIAIRMSNPAELNSLMDAPAYEESIKSS